MRRRPEDRSVVRQARGRVRARSRTDAPRARARSNLGVARAEKTMDAVTKYTRHTLPARRLARLRRHMPPPHTPVTRAHRALSVTSVTGTQTSSARDDKLSARYTHTRPLHLLTFSPSAVSSTPTPPAINHRAPCHAPSERQSASCSAGHPHAHRRHVVRSAPNAPTAQKAIRKGVHESSKKERTAPREPWLIEK